MKLLIAPLHYWYEDAGGEVGWAFDFIRSIQAESVNAIVANKNDSSTIPNVEFLELYNKKYQTSNTRSLIFHIKCFIVARKIIISSKPDVVHHFLPFSLDTTFNLLAIFGYTKKSKFIVGPIQTHHTYGEKRTFLSQVLATPLKYLSTSTLRKADTIIAITDEAKTKIINLGIDPKKILIIPPGIAIDKASLVKSQHRQICENRIELVSVGQLIPRKGYDLLLRALREILKTNSNVRLRIVGSGPEEHKLRELAGELRLGEHVKFEGFVLKSKVVNFYRDADFFVSMSRSESWGQVYIEAMASGLPVLAASNIGSDAILKDLSINCLTPPGDYMTFASRLLELIENKPNLQVLKKIVQNYVYSKYSWDDAVAPLYLRAYGIDKYRST